REVFTHSLSGVAGSPPRPFQRADDRGMTRARLPEPRLLSLKVLARRYRLLQAPAGVLDSPLGLVAAVLRRLRGLIRRRLRRRECFLLSRRYPAPPRDQAT